MVDAKGLLVLPGAIDVHTHTRVATDAEPDRFFQDSVAAAYGGTTTFLSFNNPGTGISEAAQRTLRAGIDEWILRAAGDSAIDYGLSAVVTAQQDDPMRDLEHAIRRGVPTFKAFMVYDFGIEPERLAADARKGCRGRRDAGAPLRGPRAARPRDPRAGRGRQDEAG